MAVDNRDLKNLDKEQLELMAHCFNSGVYVSDLYNEIENELIYLGKKGGENITDKTLISKIKLMGNLTLPCGIDGNVEQMLSNTIQLVEKGDYVLAKQIFTDVGDSFSVTILKGERVDKIKRK